MVNIVFINQVRDVIRKGRMEMQPVKPKLTAYEKKLILLFAAIFILVIIF
jgi:cell division protein FtsL